MAKPPSTEEVFQRAKSNRERARAAAEHSTKLLHETARLNDAVHHTETVLRELKKTVKDGEDVSRRIKRQPTKKPAGSTFR